MSMYKKALFTAFVLFTANVFAATTTWIGGLNTNWAYSTNWNGGVPNSTRNVYITDVAPSSGNCMIYSGTNGVTTDLTMYNTGTKTNVTLTIQSGANLTVSPSNFDMGYYGTASNRSTLTIDENANLNISGYFLNGNRPGLQYINIGGTVSANTLGLYAAPGGNGRQFINFTSDKGKLIINGDITYTVNNYWAGTAILDRGAGSSDPQWGDTRGIVATYDSENNKTTITPIQETEIIPETTGYLPGDINGDKIVNLVDVSILALQYLDEPGQSITKLPWVDARNFNSGVLNDTTISQAVSAIGSSAKTLLLAEGTWQINNSIIIPENINLKFQQGAILNISDGKTVTINGPIETPVNQIFSGEGNVIFGSLVKDAYPQWWSQISGIDDTKACQAALDCGVKTIRFVPAVYSIDGVDRNLDNEGNMILYGGLRPASNTTLVFEPGAKLKAITNGEVGYSVIKIDNKNNVRVIAPTIEGERSTHTGTTGEFGMGILIQNASTNIIVKDANVYDCWGDGIFIGTHWNPPSDGVFVENSIFNNNRRNGCSVTNAKNVLFRKCTFSNSNGTSPQKGVDVEPDHATDFIQNIVFEDCYSYGNISTGFSIAKDGALDNPILVTFRGCTSKDDGFGFGVDQGPSNTNGGMVFISDCYVINPKTTGFACGWANLPITINGLNVISPNQSSQTSPEYGSGIVVYMGDSDRYAGNIMAKNVCVESTDDKALYAVCLKNDSSMANSGIENIDFEVTTNLPNDKRMFKNEGPFYGYCNVRFADEPVYDTTVSLNAAAAEKFIGQTITNKGAANDITISLTSAKSASKGSEFTFIVKAANGMTIDMTGFSLLPGNKTSYYSNITGSKLKIRSNGTNWFIVEQIGTWQ
ncbi:MAG: hypothetical protein A2Y10_10585 [Planctomycetes bacterium GWF2_41_51]|nr:MAG: hypothetical protein A2Y10_10585 [Planctomycetes bacterium GWF2_41_51]HBG26922.1 hypothetical protein [Phycisphaerales bacterium]